jgi:hypothetical protein
VGGARRGIRRRLEELGGQAAWILTSVTALRWPPAAKRRRRKALAKARAAWKAQGRYLGAVRQLSVADRAKVKAIREKKGVRAAITAARKMEKSSLARKAPTGAEHV